MPIDNQQNEPTAEQIAERERQLQMERDLIEQALRNRQNAAASQRP
jgi:hypothetical protein